MRRAIALACFGVLAFVGCSALVSSEIDNVSCHDENTLGPPACPSGSACHGGKCVACAPKDICANGIDDDCNGQVDDKCGTDSGSGGAAGSGGFEQGGTAGVAGTIVNGGTAGVPSGGDGGIGGTGVGGDGALLSRLGEPCVDTSGCVTGLFCTAPNTHGGTSSAMVCAKPCCKSEECLGGSGDGVCYPALSGYGICLPASAVGRPPPGAKPAGSVCGNAGECRSGACAGTCKDSCCSNANCPGAAPYCTLDAVPDAPRNAFQCGTSSGVKVLQNSCTDGSECQSKFCLGTTSGGKCSVPCCRKSDCGTWKCTYATVGSDDLRLCAQAGPSGSTPNGQACSFPSDCASGWCVNIQTIGQICTDVCCSDEDCGVTGLVCRPATTQNNDVLLICRPM